MMKIKAFLCAALIVSISAGATLLLSSCGSSEKDVSEPAVSGVSVSSGDSVSGSDAAIVSDLSSEASVGSSSAAPSGTTAFSVTTSSVLPGTTAASGIDDVEVTTVVNKSVDASVNEKDAMVNKFWGIGESTTGESGSNASSSKFIEDLGNGFSVYDVSVDGESTLLLMYFLNGKAYPVSGDSYSTDSEREEVLQTIYSDAQSYKKNLARTQTFTVLVWDTLYESIANGDMSIDDILGYITGY